MIRVKHYAQHRLVEFTVEGVVTQADLRTALRQTRDHLKGQKKARLLEHIVSFEGITPAAMWTDLTEALPLIGDIERVAVVTDETWIRTAAQAAGVLPFLDIKAYGQDDIGKARAWLTGP